VAGNDEAAKKAVAEVVAKSGFEPIDGGPLANSRFLEQVGEMNIWSSFFLGWGTSAAPAWTKAA
jgi:predicted dinucleotide-binding enzyme